MPINDDVSKPIKLIEKPLKQFKWTQFMKPTVSLLIMYVLLDTHMLQILTN